MKTSVIVRSNLIHLIGLCLMNVFIIVYLHMVKEKNLSQLFEAPLENFVMAFLMLLIYEGIFLVLFFASIILFDVIFFKKYNKNLKMYFTIETVCILIFLLLIVLSFYPNLLLAMGIFSVFFFFSQYFRYLWIKKNMRKLNKILSNPKKEEK